VNKEPWGGPGDDRRPPPPATSGQGEGDDADQGYHQEEAVTF